MHKYNEKISIRKYNEKISLRLVNKYRINLVYVVK